MWYSAFVGTTMNKIRIDAGKSRRGWSYYSPVLQCAYMARLDMDNKNGVGTAPPLLTGTLGHDIQAHHHTIEAINAYGSVIVNGQLYDDSSIFMSPEEAVIDHAEKEPDHEPFVDKVVTAYQNYKINPPLIDRQIMVETELVGVLGRKRGKFGYWLVREDCWDQLEEEVDTLPAGNGETIKLALMNVEGSRFHKKPIYLSRRLDLVTADNAGFATVIDHKHQNNIWSDPNKYNVDMGFTAIWMLAMQKWRGAVKSVDIHGISVNPASPGKVKVTALRYSQNRANSLPLLILQAAQTRARLDAAESAGYIGREGWPMTGALEVGGNCISTYKNKEGTSCRYFKHCHHGEELPF